MKRCSKCLKDQSVDNFHKHSKGKGGLQSRRKLCMADYLAEYRRALFCGKRNKGLGLFDDDPSILARALAYLDRYRRRNDG